MSVTKMYSVLDKWTDLDKENIVDFTSVDGTVTQARLNGVPVGGGGGGTATLTVIVEAGNNAAFQVPYVSDDFIRADGVMVASEASPYEFEIPVNSILIVIEGSIVDTSGDINYDSDNDEYQITGNCSVTVGGGGGD